MLLLFFTIMLFFLPFLCSAATMVVMDVEKFEQSPSSLSVYKFLMTSELIVAISSTVNPLMCLWRVRDLRKAVKTEFRRIFGLQQLDSTEQDNQQT
jgi:hypothetical protein